MKQAFFFACSHLFVDTEWKPSKKQKKFKKTDFLKSNPIGKRFCASDLPKASESTFFADCVM